MLLAEPMLRTRRALLAAAAAAPAAREGEAAGAFPLAHAPALHAWLAVMRKVRGAPAPRPPCRNGSKACAARPTVAPPTMLPHPLPPYCCPYPCPYCILPPSDREASGFTSPPPALPLPLRRPLPYPYPPPSALPWPENDKDPPPPSYRSPYRTPYRSLNFCSPDEGRALTPVTIWANCSPTLPLPRTNRTSLVPRLVLSGRAPDPSPHGSRCRSVTPPNMLQQLGRPPPLLAPY
jgi:hypothetical protein